MAAPTTRPVERGHQRGAQHADLARYQGQIEEFVEALLTQYTKRVRAMPSLRRRGGKEFNDAVWKTVSLSRFEVLVLDSPLMQRLRRVRQLGVVHWVYPCAGHSRIEHSIGTVHTVQLLINSLIRDLGTESLGEDPRPTRVLPADWVNLLRLVALVHDVGHGLMSHVVENALKSRYGVDELLEQFAEEAGIERCSLSEAAAYYILGTDAFRELILAALDRTGEQLPDGWQRKVQDAIIGKPIHPRWPLLQELISGPFDADKLDYMARDAQMGGVPNMTDIARLIQKVRVTELPPDRLPPEIGESVRDTHPTYFVQGILLSGGRALDELMIARTLLFDKMYRHQKARAVEAMVSNAFELILPLLDSPEIHTLPLKVLDDDFISLTSESVGRHFGVEGDNATARELLAAADLISRIRDRDLFVRAYTFSHTMPQDPFREDSHQRQGLEKLRRAFGSGPNPEERAALLESIVETAESVITHSEDLLGGLEERVPVRQYVALDPFSDLTRMNEMARAYLVTPDRALVKFRQDSAESPSWSNAYLMTRDLGYVFAAPELAPAVYLACEAVFRERYGVRTPPSALDYSKVDKETVDGIRQRLEDRGFYDGRPADLRPVPERLRRADVGPKLTGIAKNLRTFDPYAVPGEIREPGMVDEHRIHTWLRQFRDDDEIDCALRVLQAISMLSRKELRKTVVEFIAAARGFERCYVCQFGGPKDSSAILTYFAGDLAGELGLRVTQLQDALLSGDGAPILFVDDYLGSGRQSVGILKGWFGETYEELSEDHGPELPAMLAAELKERRLGFAFVFGTNEGRERLEDAAHEAGLEVTVHVHRNESELPCAFGDDAVQYRSNAAAEQFRLRCEQIGRQLLKSSNPGWPPDRIDDRVLGYGNHAYLLAFPYNVPTATLTLLWSEGTVDGVEWFPLLPRRKKT